MDDASSRSTTFHRKILNNRDIVRVILLPLNCYNTYSTVLFNIEYSINLDSLIF